MCELHRQIVLSKLIWWMAATVIVNGKCCIEIKGNSPIHVPFG